MPKPKTDVRVKLKGEGDNFYYIQRKVRQALLDEGYGDLADQFYADTKGGSYENLLQKTMAYVQVD